MYTANELNSRLIDLIDKLHRIPADFYINREITCDKFILDVTEADDCLTILKEYIPNESVSFDINPTIKEISVVKREITLKTNSGECWEITFTDDQYDEVMGYYSERLVR